MEKETGVVKWFNDRKGYGFIAPDGREPIVFFDSTACTRRRAGGTSFLTAPRASARSQQAGWETSLKPASKDVSKVTRWPTVTDKLRDYDSGTSELEEAISAISGEVAPTWESGLRV